MIPFSLNAKLQKWPFAFFVVPLVTLAIVAGVYKTLYPLLTYDTFPIQFLSTTSIAISVIFDALLISLFLSRFYNLKSSILLSIWMGCSLIAIAVNDGIYDGNPNSAFALDLFEFQILAAVITIAWVVISQTRSKNRHPRAHKSTKVPHR